MARRSRAARPSLPFARKLVLYRWLLGLFGAQDFEEIARHLRDETLEGQDDNNVHRFCTALCLHLSAEGRPELPDAVLREHDQAITDDLRRLNERRLARGERPIVWKYFQYMALLCTEIYLERYFRNPDALLLAFDKHIAAFNRGQVKADRITPLDRNADARSQLNKIAFWMATGSGKTLLMHAHIRQYRRLLDRHGAESSLNRIILLTPNEGLSQQHLREFDLAGIPAGMFDKDGGGLLQGHAVDIIEVTKLKDEMGERTVAVDAFEGDNLVLVDEGHRGASSGGKGAWMRYRNALCERGFSFEYSATFGQAVKGSPSLVDVYARTTLFDYSYSWFYRDGFGKDYRILNLDQGADGEWMEKYLTGCLLAFFQQQRLFREREASFRGFNLERPLWVFVGGSVTARLAKRDASDIIAILQFLARYVSNRNDGTRRIDEILSLGLDANGANVFAGRFPHLAATRMRASAIFEETLGMLFNAPGGGALHVENLKSAPGEVALRVGENPPFGVVNVGDDTKLAKLSEEAGIEVSEREFSGSLFHDIGKPQSTVNVLIGARKFTEGWNSWRVSTMGLMNVGKSEGAQIIQLFGRGVRLKGYGICLKRSARAALPPGVERPAHIELLETLQIFGIHASYMAQFRDFLEDEGLPADDQLVEFHLPIVKNVPGKRLKTIRLKKTIGGVSTELGRAFRKLGPVPTLRLPDPEQDSAEGYLQENPVVLDWYPKIQAMQSEALAEDVDFEPNSACLSRGHVALLDVDRLVPELERFRVDRGWQNLSVTPDNVRALLANDNWYRLLIPASELAFDSIDKVRRWQDIALALLKVYMERYYAFRRQQWELPHLRYATLAEDDRNFPVNPQTGEAGYRILIDGSDPNAETIALELTHVQRLVEQGDLSLFEHRFIKAIGFHGHIYQPLLCVQAGAVEVSPVPLNESEFQFVNDLRKFCNDNGERLQDNELHLLRNQSRGRGIGFFEAGNFHPDFILWLFDKSRQHVVFVDPKGLRNIGFDDPKVRFFETVKEIEQRLNDPRVVLDSFIVSNTPSLEIGKLWSASKADMERRHILFQGEDGDTYIGRMLEIVRLGA